MDGEVNRCGLLIDVVFPSLVKVLVSGKTEMAENKMAGTQASAT